MDRGRSGLSRSRSAQVKLKIFMVAYDERLDGSGQFGLRHPFEGYCPENHGFVPVAQWDQPYGGHVVIDG